MKMTKWKLAASCALLGLSTMALQAQSDPPQGPPPGGGPHGQWRGERGGGPERQLAMLTRRLNLTAEQQTGVKALLEQQATQVMALRTKTPSEQATPPTAEARAAERKQMDAIRDETDTKIAALLNEEQKKTFTDLLAQRKAAMGRREAEGGDGPPPPPLRHPAKTVNPGNTGLRQVQNPRRSPCFPFPGPLFPQSLSP